MLLNFYELSVYSQIDHIYDPIEDFIKNHDIDSYKDEKEFSIYNLFRLINNYIKDNSFTNRGEILKSLNISRKYQKTFDFEHLNWFLRKKNDMELLRFIDQIVN
ncbi:hypothetical protein [Arcobacter peruensis]|uniref:hypothetical protein n=1 Tax=Arcobacter peruensis TaxID=2320140 RepID=UPI000F0907F0|nr:hypothetical protein [Arcobacter peruensis]